MMMDQSPKPKTPAEAEAEKAEQMEILRRATEAAEALLAEKAEAEKNAGPIISKKEKEPEKIMSPEEEVDDFIREFRLESFLPAEFINLSIGQKLFVVHGLKQRIVDLVKTDTQTQYSETLRSLPLLKKIAFGVLGRKEATIKRGESKIFAELKETEEGRNLIVQDLIQLTRTTRERDVFIDESGEKPIIRFMSSGEASNQRERDKIYNFNLAANAFREMPYEWGQERGGKHKKDYDKAKADYEKAREDVLSIKTGKETPNQKGKAMLEILQLDNIIQMDQLLNTHPEVEKELAHLAKTDGGREFVKDCLSSLQTLTGGKNWINKALFAGGYATRWATISIFGSIGTPIAGALIGGLRGRFRAKGTLEERKKQARHGQKDTSEEANKVVSADKMTGHLQRILQDLEDPSNTPQKHEALLTRLRIRIGVTQEKTETGLMDFGDTKSILNNQFNLVNILNRALVVSESYEKTNKAEVKNRIAKLLSFRAEKISEAQQKFITKQMLRGAIYGISFATAGYVVRDVGEHLGWWGNSGTIGTAQESTISQPEESAGFIERTKNWMSSLWSEDDVEASGSTEDISADLDAKHERTLTKMRTDSIARAGRHGELMGRGGRHLGLWEREVAPTGATPPVEASAPLASMTPSEVEQYIKAHPGATHEIHRSWYDNNSEVFDKNELKTHWGGENGTGINAEGKYVLDINKMTAEGSFHGNLSANVQELLKGDKLRFLISATSGTQNQVFELPIDANGQIIVDPNTDIGKMFFTTDVKGHAVFTGRFGEVAEQIDDKNNFRILSTIEGSHPHAETIIPKAPGAILTPEHVETETQAPTPQGEEQIPSREELISNMKEKITEAEKLNRQMLENLDTRDQALRGTQEQLERMQEQQDRLIQTIREQYDQPSQTENMPYREPTRPAGPYNYVGDQRAGVYDQFAYQRSAGYNTGYNNTAPIHDQFAGPSRSGGENLVVGNEAEIKDAFTKHVPAGENIEFDNSKKITDAFTERTPAGKNIEVDDSTKVTDIFKDQKLGGQNRGFANVTEVGDPWAFQRMEDLNLPTQLQENIFDLKPNELGEIYRVHERIIPRIAPDTLVRSGGNIDTWWSQAKTLSAREILEKPSVGQAHLADYLKRLTRVTGLQPAGKGLLGLGTEQTVDNFMYHALQKATEMGRLSELR
jgi:hypothetical protein